MKGDFLFGLMFLQIYSPNKHYDYLFVDEDCVTYWVPVFPSQTAKV